MCDARPRTDGPLSGPAPAPAQESPEYLSPAASAELPAPFDLCARAVRLRVQLCLQLSLAHLVRDGASEADLEAHYLAWERVHGTAHMPPRSDLGLNPGDWPLLRDDLEQLRAELGRLDRHFAAGAVGETLAQRLARYRPERGRPGSRLDRLARAFAAAAPRPGAVAGGPLSELALAVRARYPKLLARSASAGVLPAAPAADRPSPPELPEPQGDDAASPAAGDTVTAAATRPLRTADFQARRRRLLRWLSRSSPR